MADTSIEWTDATWNPVAGCSIVSAGCTNCYAMRMAARLQAMEVKKYDGLTRKSGKRHVWTGKIKLDYATLETPKNWRVPKKIFVNSMSDLFHEDVPFDFISKVWNVMSETPQHTYQILTKRPDNMFEYFKNMPDLGILQNVWLGTSVEDHTTLHRINELRSIPAAVRFISFEPLIGPVGQIDLQDIHWAIVGGESGPQARYMDQSWVDEILDACEDAGVAFFFKQWGGTNKKAAGRTYQGRTWDSLPEVSI